MRDLNKAYIGFLGDSIVWDCRQIVTGRWGCGAFGGDDQLKFFIQWIAASAVLRPMRFITWDMDGVAQLCRLIEMTQDLQVERVFGLLMSYQPHRSLFDYLEEALAN